MPTKQERWKFYLLDYAEENGIEKNRFEEDPEYGIKILKDISESRIDETFDFYAAFIEIKNEGLFQEKEGKLYTTEEGKKVERSILRDFIIESNCDSE